MKTYADLARAMHSITNYQDALDKAEFRLQEAMERPISYSTISILEEERRRAAHHFNALLAQDLPC
jgi:hypothetical protein